MKPPKDFEKKSKFFTPKKAKSETDFYLSNLNRVKKKINVSRQSITVDKRDLQVSSRGLTLPELLVKLNHPVPSTKQKALSGIFELLRTHKFENKHNLGAIAQSVWPLRWNEESKIRRLTDTILKHILEKISGKIWFYRLAIIYLTEGYSNPSHLIIKDALEFTDYLAKESTQFLSFSSSQLTNLILKINSPENIQLQCHLIYEITRSHPFKSPSFLYSENLETLLFNVNTNNSSGLINFYERAIALAVCVFKSYNPSKNDMLEQLKSLLECAILIKESLKFDKNLISIIKNYTFFRELPYFTQSNQPNQLNEKSKRVFYELVTHLLITKWQILLLIDNNSRFYTSEIESESLCNVINSPFVTPLPKSLESLLTYLLAIRERIVDFETIYYKVKNLNYTMHENVCQNFDSTRDTNGCLIELIISLIKQNLPTLLIQQVLSHKLNAQIITNSELFTNKVIQNNLNLHLLDTFSDNLLVDIATTFKIQIANLA